ncbi:MAG: DUF2007 domain-containing protein [SAR324 cluster bacterium]|nr:DUF2007 domain-containing protein [SAR324 cluster bacterium]
MQKVYSSPETNLVHFAKSILDEHEIACVILREQLAGAVGGLAPLDTWPELWVLETERSEEARILLESALQNSALQQKSWQCPGCGENIEAQFGQCWQCDTVRD